MKRIIAVILAVCMLFALTACGGSGKQGVAADAEKADVGDVALRPEGEADRIYENEGLRLLIPLEYDEFLLTETPEKDADGMLFSVSEKASLAAANYEEGAGWLFGIRRIGEAAVHEMLGYDMSGMELFAKDAHGDYYLYCHPTDVRFYRENNEAMARDQDLWTAYNEWAWNRVRAGFLEENSGLTAVTYGNSSLEMYLARLAWQGDVEYTVSTTQYGPLAPEDGFDAGPFVERLMSGLELETVDEEAPDGEYVVLSIPEDDTRFDFFSADRNLIRQVWSDGYELLFGATYADGTTEAGAIMQEWYDALAEGRDFSALSGPVGGWTIGEDTALSDAAEASFEKAKEGLLGVDYVPVALLGTQIVSGTNYAVLTRARAVVPGAQPYNALVTVHEDLQGETEVLGITVLDPGDIAETGMITNAEAPEGQLDGGWTIGEDAVLSDGARAAFEKAVEGLLGMDYVPVALLGTQVVSGTNYSVLARAQAVVPDAQPFYMVMTVYENLQGEAELLGTADLALGQLY